MDEGVDRSDRRVVDLQRTDAVLNTAGSDVALKGRTVLAAAAAQAVRVAVHAVVLRGVDSLGLLYRAVPDADERRCRLFQLRRTVDGDSDLDSSVSVRSDQPRAILHNAA